MTLPAPGIDEVTELLTHRGKGATFKWVDDSEESRKLKAEVQQMLESKPIGVVGDCFKMWYVMRPMTVDLFERYWRLTGIDEELFDSRLVHFDSW